MLNNLPYRKITYDNIIKQWRSALAVNYPARKFGIKRGDSFEIIQEKSKGKVVAIHLPVTPVDDDDIASPTAKGKGGSGVATSPQQDGDDNGEVESSELAYNEEFNQPTDVREEMYRLEKNKMRSPSEGKACLDR